MAVVRYIALAALVIWVGATLNALAGDAFRRLSFVALGCGAAILVGLLLMKFIGPPPRAFAARAVLVVLMLAVATLARLRGQSPGLLAINLVLGLVLLSWYARE